VPPLRDRGQLPRENYNPRTERPASPIRTRNDNPAVPRSPRRRRNPSNPNVNETVTTNDVPPVTILDNPLTPSCPTILTTPNSPSWIPGVLGGIYLDSILQDREIESFPGILGGSLDDLFIPFFEASRATNRANANALRNNLIADGQIANDGDHPHHLVPALDGKPAARLLRERLGELGVDVNEAANGVFLSPEQHSQQWLHRGSTYDLIRDRLSRASDADEAREILRQIASEIRDGEFPPNRQ
jgi:A nuclease family of the HNH/ENDO VII superfamily with conserved AHH